MINLDKLELALKTKSELLSELRVLELMVAQQRQACDWLMYSIASNKCAEIGLALHILERKPWPPLPNIQPITTKLASFGEN